MFHQIQRFYKKIKRSIKYIRLVWKTETWDYSYALEFWKESLLEIKDSMLNGHIAHPEKHTKRIDEIIFLLNRIQNYDEYVQKFTGDYTKKYGKLTYEFRPTDRPGLSKMVFTNEKRNTPYAKKEMDLIIKHQHYLYMQDIDRLSFLLKKYLRNFWD